MAALRTTVSLAFRSADEVREHSGKKGRIGTRILRIVKGRGTQVSDVGENE